MKPYHNVDVCLTYQNSGSAWLGVLRGKTEDINLVFNGLYNYCATNGGIIFHDHLAQVATFWTDKRAMRRFFFNQFFIPRCTGDKGQGRLIRTAMRAAQKRVQELRDTSHEFFATFGSLSTIESYSTGAIRAERPDHDIKDAILAYAFKEKETVTHKVVDSE